MSTKRYSTVAGAMMLAAFAVVAAPHVAGKTPPEEARTIVQVASEAGTFKTLVTALESAGLVETLQGPGPFTVFAPSDAAFAKLSAGTIEALLADKAKLTSILTYHVLAGKVMSGDIVKSQGAKPATVNGQALDIVLADGKVLVNRAHVVKADIAASNGVIHVIDTVLLPESSASR